MLADDMKLAMQRSFMGHILYRGPDPFKKRRHNLIFFNWKKLKQGLTGPRIYFVDRK